jgi:uncharacterized protein (TIGR02453 family)
MANAAFSGFSSKTLEFLADLDQHNDRAWFEANKARYEAHVREPALAFVRAMAPHLAKLSKRFVADDRKLGGSLMRVHRDTRFSKDKTPYKTNVGIQFRHEKGKDVHAPGFYVHLSLEECFLGAGMWHPEPSALALVRKRIEEKPAALAKVLADRKLKKHWKNAGDSLKRPPRGVDPEHPMIEELKRKDHILVADLRAEDLTSKKAPAFVAERFAASSPYMGFLCEAIGVNF